MGSAQRLTLPVLPGQMLSTRHKSKKHQKEEVARALWISAPFSIAKQPTRQITPEDAPATAWESLFPLLERKNILCLLQ